MAKKKPKRRVVYFGMRSYLIDQVDTVAQEYGPITPAPVRHLKWLIKIAVAAGKTRADQVEERRRRKATAPARAKRVEGAAARHRKIAAFFHRLPKNHTVRTRLAATAKQFGVSVTTVKTAIRRVQ
jgi:hypothetical protein